MAQDTVRTFEEFMARFPQNGLATASFIAIEGNQRIRFQVKQPNGRFLTYVQKMGGQTHGVIKRQAESLVTKLDKAGLKHDPLIDDTPVDARMLSDS
jgi:hypothetical protein